ncbi:hypothetical protein MTR_6g090270 [Medicago truncatula]|uniref:Uncharacterized protein n=1 Tax=Medicago truncatula TaxID=3880 RepID=G7KHZ6_MEDTR|nr:hypothetical protein MTR_6g090270 [Medicago truncatula]
MVEHTSTRNTSVTLLLGPPLPCTVTGGQFSCHKNVRGSGSLVLVEDKGGSPGKMQKALANGRLPGVLPGAESPANLLIAN